MLDYESNYINKKLIAGVDEAGRGPLAGPVAVAAVIMPLTKRIEGINDSKQLTEKKREQLYELIMSEAIAVHCVMIDIDIIERINILKATICGMKQAIEGLKITPDLVLIDAVKLDIDIDNESIIRGDCLSYNIAAASIIAKVNRDRLMQGYSNEYPLYGFDKHKGYATREHIEALKRYGASPIHRQSFLKKII